MCGIAGLVHHDLGRSPLKGVDPERMLSSLHRRGPDASGRFDDPACTLLHTRLSILDLDPRSNQPFVSERWALAFNGEIFNFRALRGQLQTEGDEFVTTGDTEVLFKAIARWGVFQTSQRLAGMFAFAAYDRVDRVLYLVRDRLAIKPLFYLAEPDGLAFASWPAALLTGMDRPWRLRLSAVEDFFRLGAGFRGDHLVEGLLEVGPGTVMEVREGRIATRSFWTPADMERGYDEAEFEALFEHVVAEHLEADVPSALFLSGGVDSSALAMAAPGLDCFHLESAEQDVAARVARAAHGKFVLARLEHHQWEDDLTALCEVTGQALASSAQPMAVSQTIREHGYTMAFSANGADELFHGYARTPGRSELDENGSLPFPFEERSFGCFSDQARHIFRSGENLDFPGARDQDPRAASMRFLLDLQGLVARDGLSQRASYRMFELKTYVAGDLNTTLDHASMYWSSEVRVPFLDHRLVEYALALSPRDLVTEQWGRKSPLKAYLHRKGLFEGCWHRPKLGFSLSTDSQVPLRMAQLEALRELDREGYVRFVPRAGRWHRDYLYLLNAALAFRAWKRVWIDSGKVAR